MYRIDLRRVRIAKAGLSAQEVVLNGIAEKLEKNEILLKEMTFGGEISVRLAKIRNNIHEDCAALHQMVICLENVREVYKKTEQTVSDMYDLEYITYPETTFGTSYITGFEPYEELLVFRESKRRV